VDKILLQKWRYKWGFAPSLREPPPKKLLRRFLMMRGSELHPQTPQHLARTIHKICEQIKFRFLGQVFRTWGNCVFSRLTHE